MTCIFVQVRCKSGQIYAATESITDRVIHSKLYSTSGEHDLLVKLYVPGDDDVGRFVNDNLASVEGIDRTLTTLTFKAF